MEEYQLMAGNGKSLRLLRLKVGQWILFVCFLQESQQCMMNWNELMVLVR